MVELLKTTDVVLISFVEALLKGAGISVIVLDAHMSLTEGSIGIFPRRLMVGEGDFTQARRLVDESVAGTKENYALDGRVRVLQPAQGYRAAMDTIFLAAAVPAGAGDTVHEVGAGVGTAALCLATRVAGVSLTGIELQANLVEIAERNIDLNDLADRISILQGDLMNAPPPSPPADHVMMNPPYHRADNARPSPNTVSRTANMEGDARLDDWLRYALGAVKTKGSLTMVHRADRLDEVLRLLDGRAGEIVVFPLWPGVGERPTRSAKRIILRCRKDSRAAMRLAPGLVLHEADGAYTAAAQAVLRDAMALEL